MAGIIPSSWSLFKLPSSSSTPLNLVSSFALRLAQLERISTSGVRADVRLGHFFAPRGWLSATQQFAAREGGESLEKYRLVLGLAEQGGEGLTFGVTGTSLSFFLLYHYPFRILLNAVR